MDPNFITTVAVKSLECPVCFNEFDGKTHLPRVLPCGNNICNSCLSQVLIINRKCPLCQEVLSNIPETFPINLFVRDLALSRQLSTKLAIIQRSNDHAGVCRIHKHLQRQLRCNSHKVWICSYCLKEQHMNCTTTTVHNAIEEWKMDETAYLDNQIKEMVNKSRNCDFQLNQFIQEISVLKKKIEGCQKEKESFKEKTKAVELEKAKVSQIKSFQEVDRYVSLPCISDKDRLLDDDELVQLSDDDDDDDEEDEYETSEDEETTRRTYNW